MIIISGVEYIRESQIPDGLPYISEYRVASGICPICYAQRRADTQGEYPIMTGYNGMVLRMTTTYCLEYAQKILPSIQALCNESTRKKKRA